MEHKIEGSSVHQTMPSEELRIRETAEWKNEAKEAIDAYNKTIQVIGLFSDGVRSF